ncbi:MAG: glycosyltransferase family 2 protein [Deltaproteobacteria bacterium]|nr:glycosyltransferase family 2 protein [Deltaproteobacteria bacterium]
MKDYCDIVLPVWNQLEMTKECLKSVLDNTDYPYRLIIVDNGSDSNTAAYLQTFSEENNDIVMLLRNDVNVGYIKATNRGMKESRGKHVCLLSNDTVVYPGWLSQMIAVAEKEKDIGLVNPASNHFDLSYEDTLNSKHEYIGMGRCIGFCMLAKRELIDQIGFLDERFGMGYGEDDAYCSSAHNLDYRCVMARKAYVVHIGKATFGKDKKAKENRQKQRALAKQLLGEQLKVEAFLTASIDGERPPLKLLKKLADKGVRCKVFAVNIKASLPYEHSFVKFRKQRQAVFYFSSLYRFLFDSRFRAAATESRLLYSLFSKLNFLVRKQLIYFGSTVDGPSGIIGNYDNVKALILYLKGKL